MIRFPFLAGLLWFGALLPAPAVIIQLDYTYDQANGGNFFGTHPVAKATLEAAAADLSAAITSSFAAVPSDVFTGTSGSSTANLNWSLVITNPVTDADVTLSTFSFPANTIRIYVGMRPLQSNTLGTGGPSGAGFSFGASGGTATTQSAAMNNAEAASNAAMTRGAGPILGTFTDARIGGIDVSYGVLAGSLWFDNDTDNNGSIDSDTLLDSFWHFELSPNIPSNQNDFYSVALHELLHAIGYGTSDTWDNLSSGNNWLGTEARALDPGNGVNLISGGHLRSGYPSRRWDTGTAQEAVMDPSLTTGQRKYLTQMDLAILRDLGYSTVPEPGSAALLAAAVLALSARRTSRPPGLSGGKFCRRS